MAKKNAEKMPMTPTTMVMGIINFIIGAAEIFIGLRFILKLFSANVEAPFVTWIYSTTDPLLQPFKGMFPSPTLEGGITLEFTALFAILIYELARYLLREFIIWVERVNQ